MRMQVLYKYVMGGNEEGFRGANNTTNSLMAAHPAGAWLGSKTSICKGQVVLQELDIVPVWSGHDGWDDVISPCNM